MLKTILVMFIAISAGAVGDIFLTKGMKDMGDLSVMNLRGILNATGQALTSPKLILGTALQATYFFLWLAVLSWEDLSVALPMQAFSYILVAFLSMYFLGETVSPLRWTGILLICAGVMLITKSGAS
jgi:drug/metabolite transporter (DMT)-like permease